MESNKNQGSGGQGGSGSGDNRKRNNRRRRYSSKKKPNNNNNNQGQPSAHRKKRSGNRRPNNRGGKSHKNRPLHFLKRYDQLVEQHYRARKKYFNLYHRSGPRQLLKLEKAFYQAIEDLRKFEDGLEPDKKQMLVERLKLYPLDHDYTVEKEIEKEGVMEVPLDHNEEPHYLESQKSLPSFADDTEESTGSMEDYESYKKSLE